ncbi:uncharacterized protein NEMAJ01_2354 [Nematocida major]|uniref:uncharacterized protein n=1 Tax=Nematocida major TaxID=1912982 RepID=UPI00200758DE|nr:uncharacterized protein NEMAJ01_2354 [Nematocida major]KAH9387458.1 hypothetical protein NEMAJ01_2354 [Nematocida major]
MLQLVVVLLVLYICHLLSKHGDEAERRRELEKKLHEATENLKRCKEYERSYHNLKASYLDLLDRAVGKKKKGE